MGATRVGLLAAGAGGAAVERRLRASVDAGAVVVARTASAAEAMATAESLDVLVDAFADDSSVPALHAGLGRGIPVVAANPAALASARRELEAAALLSGAPVRVDPALGGPSARRLVAQVAAGPGVATVEATLDGWVGEAVAALAAGATAGELARSAVTAGRTPEQVRRSLDGTASAEALAVLAGSAFDRPVRTADVAVMGVDWLGAADGERARAEGRRWVLVATATPLCARVEPVPLALDHPLAGGHGRTLVVTGLDRSQTVLRLGRGGPEAVAAAVAAEVRDLSTVAGVRGG